MNKKFIKDLTYDELTKVFHANEKLRNDIYDDMVESEMLWISEQLDYLRDSLSNWSIGAYNHNYIQIKDAEKFIEALNELEKSIPVLIDKDTPKLEKALELKDKYRSINAYTDEFDELVEEFEELANDLADIVTHRFTKRLDGCSEEKYQIDYFIEFYSNSRLDADNCYIKTEDNDYILYEDSVIVYK